MDTKIRIRMPPAEEEIEEFEVHAARLFDKEAATRFQHTPDLINHFTPFRDMMQNSKDDIKKLEAVEIVEAQKRGVEEFKFDSNDDMLQAMGLTITA